MTNHRISLSDSQINEFDPCGYGISYFEPLQAPDNETNLLIIIICYKAVNLTIDCLASLAPQVKSMDGIRVAVCENGTGKTASEQLRRIIKQNNWDSWCDLTVISPNRGFSGGNNIVLRQALKWPKCPNNFLLLNTDTIVLPGALAELMNASELNPRAGIISSGLEWPDKTPRVNCFNHFHPLNEFIRTANTGVITKLLKKFYVPQPLNKKPKICDWTCFACAMIRKEVIHRVGMLDDGYFLYFDDSDYCRRVWESGWQILNWPASRVVHLEGKSNPLPTLQGQHKRLPWYHYASRARYYTKFYGKKGLFLANICWYLGWIIASIKRLFFSTALSSCEHEAIDIWTNWKSPMRLPSKGQE